VRALAPLVPLLAALVAGLAACGTTGRDLRAPAPDAVSPTRSSTPRSASATTTSRPTGSVAPGAELALSSPAWITGSPLPVADTCEGSSPELVWRGVPADTAQLALAVVDRGSPRRVHWLVTGIAPTDGSVASGAVPNGAKVWTNSFGRASWTAPCPTSATTASYDFVVLALPAPLTLPAGTPASEAFERLSQAAGGARATLVATVTG